MGGGTTTDGYTGIDERPAPATSAVGNSVVALSSTIGISGAARIGGASIPSPNSASLRPREAATSANTMRTAVNAAKARSKVERIRGKRDGSSRVAVTTENYNLIQGAWTISGLLEGPVFVGDEYYEVHVTAGVCYVASGAYSTTEVLQGLTSLSNTTLVDYTGATYVRDTSGEMEACVTEFTGGGGAGGDITSSVGQVSFSDNSTFAYDFSTPSQPTAVFVQLEGADEYFVVPFSALIANGGGYTINFFGPTPSDSVAQVINQLINGRIIVQVFYGSATEEQLLTDDFPGVDTASNWSAPTYVNCVAQPVASGELQFTLTWNTEGDIDLHVIEPSGNEIYYANSLSDSGGQLDVDNTWGYGPENIYWDSTPPAGTYSVFVDDFDCIATGYTLTVTKNGVPTTYTGSFAAACGESTPIQVTLP